MGAWPLPTIFKPKLSGKPECYVTIAVKHLFIIQTAAPIIYPYYPLGLLSQRPHLGSFHSKRWQINTSQTAIDIRQETQSACFYLPCSYSIPVHSKSKPLPMLFFSVVILLYHSSWSKRWRKSDDCQTKNLCLFNKFSLSAPKEI